MSTGPLLSPSALIPPMQDDAVSIIRTSFECGPVDWHVRQFVLDEALGRPFHCTLHLITTELDLALEDFIGANATFELYRDDQTRRLCSYVDRIEHLGVISHRAHVRVHLVPLWAWLARTKNARIFQHKTVPEILHEVATPILQARNRSIDRSALAHREWTPRDYCVQFHESDLDFIHRLLEEEGLTYYFDHTRDDWETVVFTTTNDDFPAFRGIDGTDEVSLLHDDETPDAECLASLEWGHRTRAPRVHQRDWDWLPNPPLVYDATHEPIAPPASALESLPAVEVYDSADHRLLDARVDDRAERKQQAHAVGDATGVGHSNMTGFAPGSIFELVHEDRAGRYLLTHVTHQGDLPQADVVGGDPSAAPRYVNRFRCIHADTPYRPPRSTPAPTIPGPQTAVVTGPPGEEIYTDEHGRIKVRMHWDRSPTPAESTSCWIRVAQMWGGPGWGSVFLPRIGMEVVVTFLNGDPDRPLITGCVYNGHHHPPYPLPDHKTKSTIRSSSSPGGDGYNELTFEDAAGAEQIIVHAQKDLDETIKHRHCTAVGGSQFNSVGGHQTNTVHLDQNEAVNGNVAIDINGTRTQTVNRRETITINDDRQTTIAGHETLTVRRAVQQTFDATRTTTVTHDDRETIVNGNKEVIVSNGALRASATTKVELAQTNEHYLVLDNKATLYSATDYTVTNGRTSIASQGGTLTLRAADQLELSCGNCRIVLSKDGTLELHGNKKAVLSATGSTLTAEPLGVTTKGAKLTSEATGLHEIKGALIRIN